MGGIKPSTVKTPLATAYVPIATAFSLIHSGAAAAMGNSLMSTPSALAIAAQAVSTRLLSTHDPMCRTGGIPSAWQTARNP